MTPLSEALERELEEGVHVTQARETGTTEAVEETSSTTGLGGILTAEQTTATHPLLTEPPPNAVKRSRPARRRRTTKR